MRTKFQEKLISRKRLLRTWVKGHVPNWTSFACKGINHSARVGIPQSNETIKTSCPKGFVVRPNHRTDVKLIRRWRFLVSLEGVLWLNTNCLNRKGQQICRNKPNGEPGLGSGTSLSGHGLWPQQPLCHPCSNLEPRHRVCSTPLWHDIDARLSYWASWSHKKPCQKRNKKPAHDDDGFDGISVGGCRLWSNAKCSESCLARFVLSDRR